MAYRVYDQSTMPEILDAALVYLRHPDVALVSEQPAGVPFTKSRLQQNWTAPTGSTGFILKGGFDNPHMEAWTPDYPDVPNIARDSDNVAGAGKVWPSGPMLLHALGPDEHLETLLIGTFRAPQVFVRKGPVSVVVPPTTGASGDGGFTEADRTTLQWIAAEIMAAKNA